MNYLSAGVSLSCVFSNSKIQCENFNQMMFILQSHAWMLNWFVSYFNYDFVFVAVWQSRNCLIFNASPPLPPPSHAQYVRKMAHFITISKIVGVNRSGTTKLDNEVGRNISSLFAWKCQTEIMKNLLFVQQKQTIYRRKYTIMIIISTNCSYIERYTSVNINLRTINGTWLVVVYATNLLKRFFSANYLANVDTRNSPAHS